MSRVVTPQGHPSQMNVPDRYTTQRDLRFVDVEFEKYMNESFDTEECCTKLHHTQMDDRIAKGSALNSLLNELLEEKISTQKKNHWILGPEDLNDTLVYDFEIEEAE